MSLALAHVKYLSKVVGSFIMMGSIRVQSQAWPHLNSQTLTTPTRDAVSRFTFQGFGHKGHDTPSSTFPTVAAVRPPFHPVRLPPLAPGGPPHRPELPQVACWFLAEKAPGFEGQEAVVRAATCCRLHQCLW